MSWEQQFFSFFFRFSCRVREWRPNLYRDETTSPSQSRNTPYHVWKVWRLLKRFSFRLFFELFPWPPPIGQSLIGIINADKCVPLIWAIILASILINSFGNVAPLYFYGILSGASLFCVTMVLIYSSSSVHSSIDSPSQSKDETKTKTFWQIFETRILFIFSSLIFLYFFSAIVDVYYTFYLTEEFGIPEQGTILI